MDYKYKIAFDKEQLTFLRMVTTFLPFVSFEDSLAVLDNQRLGKQRVEAAQIIKAVNSLYSCEAKGYANHPAILMWIDYEDALAHYYNLCLKEWERRGYTNTMHPVDISIPIEDIEMPWYIGWDHFHKSHQASLLRKHPVYYKNKFQQEESLLKGDYSIDGYLDEFYIQRGYIWPSHHEDNIEHVLSLDNDTLDTYKSYSNHLCKYMPLFAPINPDSSKNASQSWKRMYTINTLQLMAKEKGIKGYSKMKKNDLLTILDISASS